MPATNSNPRPYIAHPHQAAHLAGLWAGEKSLIVAACEPQPELFEAAWGKYWQWVPKDRTQFGAWWLDECSVSETPARAILDRGPFGPVGATLAVKERWLPRPMAKSEAFYEADKPAWSQFQGWSWVIAGGRWKSARSMPKTAVRTFLRILSIDLRRVGTMNFDEAVLWGCKPDEWRIDEAEGRWNRDNPAHPWPDAWAWFATVERIER